MENQKAAEMKSKSKKGTWPQALFSLFIPIFAVFFLRWCLVEPFVIPSGSMIPSLFEHDHILVQKFGYGLKTPFYDYWLLKWKKPQRGDVVVFKYPENPDVYFIKRLIGLPGDQISIRNGKVKVNGREASLVEMNDSFLNNFEVESGFKYYKESFGDHEHFVRFYSQNNFDGADQNLEVPPDQYFMMGDNRDQSHDSRFWGFVPENLIVGPAWKIWLSCDETLNSSPYLCDPSQIRWHRLLKTVQ